MSEQNETKSFNAPARAFHWIAGILMIVATLLALYMMDMDDSPFKFELYGIHKSIGIIVLVLFLPRILWRLKSGHPGKIPTHKGWEKLASNIVSWSLYALMLGLPLSGWLMSSAGGYPISIFGLIDVPALVEKNKEIGGLAHSAHELMGDALQILILLHIAGTLKHVFVDKDLTLYRMLPLSIFKPKKPE